MRKNSLGRFFLGGLTLFYAAGVALRRFFYWLGAFKRRKLDAKVICIGNLTAGGTGKTPGVLLAVETLRQKGLPVAILSRGYGAHGSQGDIRVIDKTHLPHWSLVGDEPWMMRMSLGDSRVPILVSADRVRAGEKALADYGAKVLILDDGFQHFPLRRDLDVLMIDARDPFGGGRLIPLGNLREPASALVRAHLAVLTHADRVSPEQIRSIKDAIHSYNPKIAVLESAHRSDLVMNARTMKRHATDVLKGLTVAAVSAIGSPESFEDSLRQAGANVVQAWRFPDHHPYTEKELASIEAARRGYPSRLLPALVTTLKDYPRLPESWTETLSGDIYLLGVKLEIIKGEKLWREILCRGL